MVPPERVQKIVREAIQDSELPRAQLAREAGLSRASLEAWISGIRTPSPESIEQLANAMLKRAGELQQIAVKLLALREQLKDP